MDDLYTRAVPLLGAGAPERLAGARVAVAGLGGVGSFAAEALIRGGVGRLLLIDHDTVSPSNLNRQLHATAETAGQSKARLMAERARAINPAVEAEAAEIFLTPENCAGVLSGKLDYIVDAVDNITAKLTLALLARERGIPIISVMGTGNKLDPSRFRVGDIADTSVCPLCRVMRRELKKRGLERLRVVWSDEAPLVSMRPPASVSFVPPVAGMLAAGVVLRGIVGADSGG